MKTRHERKIQSDIMKEFGERPNILVVRKNVGLFYTKDGRPVNIGKVGESDLLLIIGGQKCPMCEFPIHPAPAMVEVKDPLGELSEEQENYRDSVCKRRGIKYIVAHSLSEAIEELRVFTENNND